ncbi:hypothetical protein J2S05_000918 [Alkalicoccobacillus murimartini]|uniref:Uncharacterized protein n=1 Tax=Alkalicoccobacillus murimartini TaxID=171685 RepID=A0ABT9YGF3_9BACI|nr:hypothetical protein [Alkalicoccobacillus murimartini]
MNIFHLYRSDENKKKMKKACETGLTPESNFNF